MKYLLAFCKYSSYKNVNRYRKYRVSVLQRKIIKMLVTNWKAVSIPAGIKMVSTIWIPQSSERHENIIYIIRKYISIN